MAGIAGIVGTTTRLAATKLAASGIQAVGSKARDAAAGILMQSKAAAFGEMPGVMRGYGFASKMLGGGGTSFAKSQDTNIRPLLQEQTKTLKEVSKNTAQQAYLMRSWDRNEDSRLARLQQSQAANAERIEKSFADNIGELKKMLRMSMGGGGGGGPEEDGFLLSFLKKIGGAIAGVAAVAGAVGLSQQAFLRTERRTQGTRRPSNTRGPASSELPGLSFLKVNPNRTENTGVSSTTSSLTSVQKTGITSKSGTTLKQAQKAVPVEDAKLRDSIGKDLKSLQKSMVNVDANTKITPQNIDTRRKLERKTKPVDTRTEEEKILDKAQARFLRDFESTSTRAFQKALTKALDLDKNVTASTASREGYIGGQLGQAVGLKKGTQRFFEKTFGKEYGSMFAPMFSQLGEAYLEVGGRLAGQALFGGVLGNKGANTLTGQIIGNLQKGNKGVAAEQLLYGLTGIASGPETIFAQRGFKDSKQGISYMADVLGAGTTAMVRNMTGFEGPAPTVIDPRTGNKIEVNSFSDIFSLGTGIPLTAKDRAKAEEIKEMQAKVVEEPANSIKHKGINASAVFVVNQEDIGKEQLDKYGFGTGTSLGMGSDAGWFNAEATKLPGVTAEQSQKKIAEATVNTPEAVYDVDESINEWGEENEARDYSIAKEDVKTQQQVGSAIAGTVAAGNAGIMGALGSLAQAIFGMGSGGGGTNIGIGFGGGGGGFGGMMMDLGTSILASKLTSGIKNPYLRAGANIVAFTGLKSIGGTFIRNLGTGGSGGYLANLRGAFGVTPGGFIDRGLNAIGLSTGANYASTMSSMAASGNVNGLTAAYQSAGYTYEQALSLAGRDISAIASQGGVAGSVASGQAANGVATQGQVRAVDNAIEAGSSGTSMSQHLQNLPYYYAAYQALTGDVKGAAITAGSYYAGTAVTASMVASGALTAGSIAAAGVTFGVSLLVGALLGGLFGKKSSRPPPRIGERAVQIKDNNNPTLVYTIYNSGGGDAMFTFADALLNVAFNTIKMFEQNGLKLSETEEIYYISIHVNDQWGTLLRIFTEPYSGYKNGQYESSNFGLPSNTSGKNMGSTASKIVKFITDLYKTKNEKSTAKADEINRIMNQKSVYQLAQGTIFELNKMDRSVQSGVFAEDPYISSEIEKSIQNERKSVGLSTAVSKALQSIPGARYYDQSVEAGGFVSEGSSNFKGLLASEGAFVPGDSENPGYYIASGRTLMWDADQKKYVMPNAELAAKYGLTGTVVKGGKLVTVSDSDGGTSYATVYNQHTGEYEYYRTPDTFQIDTSKIVSTTSTGIPILDVDASGGLSEADYRAAIDRYGYEALGMTAPPVNNVSDNSTTVNNYGVVDSADPYRNYSASTRMPMAA